MEFFLPVGGSSDNNSPICLNLQELRERCRKVKLNNFNFKVASIFLHLAGDQVLNVLKSFPFVEQDAHASASRLLEALESLCLPQFLLVYNRHLFSKCKQSHDEPVLNFLARVNCLSEQCEFLEEREGRVSNRIIEGVHDGSLRENLKKLNDRDKKKIEEFCMKSEHKRNGVFANGDIFPEDSKEGLTNDTNPVSTTSVQQKSVVNKGTNTDTPSSESEQDDCKRLKTVLTRECSKKLESDSNHNQCVKSSPETSSHNFSMLHNFPVDQVEESKISYKCSQCSMVLSNSLEFSLHHCTEEESSLSNQEEGDDHDLGITEDDVEVLEMYDELLKKSGALPQGNDVDSEFKLDNKEVDFVHVPHRKKNNIRECKMCRSTFTTAIELREHMHTVHKERYYKCDICGAQFLHKPSHWKHMLKKHPQCVPYKCEKCGLPFMMKSSLEEHLLSHNDGKVSCEACGLGFESRKTLYAHVKLAHFKGKFACDICGKTYPYQSGLKIHYMKHTGERPFVCEICGSTHTQQSYLDRHKLIHDSQQHLQCSECGANFVYKANLKSHMRTHTGEKPFVCDVCGASFRVSSGLRDHMRTHSGERPYMCKFCGKAFSRHSHRRRHQMMHTDEKSHICDICGSKFTRRSNMNAHKRSVHGRDFKPESLDPLLFASSYVST